MSVIVYPAARLKPLDVADVLDYATSYAQRTAILAGTKGLNEIWADALSDAADRGGSGLILPRAKTLYVDDGESLSNPGIHIIGNDATIIKVGYEPLFVAHASDPVLSGGRLDADATAGEMSVTLVTGAAAAGSFAKNDIVVINDLGSIGVDSSRHRAEFAVIQDVTGDVVTFWAPLQYSYASGSSAGQFARIIKAPLISNVQFSDLNVESDISIDAGDLSAEDMVVFSTNWLRNPRWNNIRLTNYLQPGILLRNTLGARVHNYTATRGGSATTGTSDPTSTEDLPGYSYAICEQGLNAGLHVSNMVAERVRHAYTTLSPEPAGNTPYGEPTGSLIANSVARDVINSAFDTHELGRHITFKSCLVENAHFVGFQVRSPFVHIDDCTVHNAYGAAVWIRGLETGNAYARNCMISNLKAINTNLGDGTGYFDATDWTEVGAVQDDANNTRIDGLFVYKSGGPAVQTGSNGDYAGQIYRNIDAIDVCQLGSNKTAIDLKDVTTAGTCQISGVRSQSSDAKVVDLVKIASAVGAAVIDVSDVVGWGHTGVPANNASASAILRHDRMVPHRIERSYNSEQFVDFALDGSSNRITSRTLTTAGKNLVIQATTDASHTDPSAGSTKLVLGVRNTTLISMDKSKLSFFGVTEVVKQSVGAALSTGGAETNTNLATRINEIRTLLINYGLAS